MCAAEDTLEDTEIEIYDIYMYMQKLEPAFLAVAIYIRKCKEIAINKELLALQWNARIMRRLQFFESFGFALERKWI